LAQACSVFSRRGEVGWERKVVPSMSASELTTIPSDRPVSPDSSGKISKSGGDETLDTVCPNQNSIRFHVSDVSISVTQPRQPGQTGDVVHEVCAPTPQMREDSWSALSTSAARTSVHRKSVKDIKFVDPMAVGHRPSNAGKFFGGLSMFGEDPNTEATRGSFMCTADNPRKDQTLTRHMSLRGSCNLTQLGRLNEHIQLARMNLWMSLEEPWETVPSCVLHGVLALVIVTSIFYSIFTRRGVESFTGVTTWEAVFNAMFFMDTLLRFWAFPRRCRFVTDPKNVIDLVSLLPFVLNEVIRVPQHFTDMEFLEWLHAYDAFLRLLKLSRYFSGWYLLYLAVVDSIKALLIPLLFLLIIVIFGSCTVYTFEALLQRTQGPSVAAQEYVTIDNIPDAIHFSMICILSMSTGPFYGMQAASTGARAIVCAMMVFGMLFMAMPIAIVGACFSQTWFDQDRIILLHKVRSRLRAQGFAKEDLRDAFDEVDVDGSGELEFTEFEDMLKTFNLPSLTATKCRRLFHYFDHDNDGVVDFPDFAITLFPDAFVLEDKEVFDEDYHGNGEVRNRTEVSPIIEETGEDGAKLRVGSLPDLDNDHAKMASGCSDKSHGNNDPSPKFKRRMSWAHPQHNMLQKELSSSALQQFESEPESHKTLQDRRRESWLLGLQQGRELPPVENSQPPIHPGGMPARMPLSPEPARSPRPLVSPQPSPADPGGTSARRPLSAAPTGSPRPVSPRPSLAGAGPQELLQQLREVQELQLNELFCQQAHQQRQLRGQLGIGGAIPEKKSCRQLDKHNTLTVEDDSSRGKPTRSGSSDSDCHNSASGYLLPLGTDGNNEDAGVQSSSTDGLVSREWHSMLSCDLLARGSLLNSGSDPGCSSDEGCWAPVSSFYEEELFRGVNRPDPVRLSAVSVESDPTMRKRSNTDTDWKVNVEGGASGLRDRSSGESLFGAHQSVVSSTCYGHEVSNINTNFAQGHDSLLSLPSNGRGNVLNALEHTLQRMERRFERRIDQLTSTMVNQSRPGGHLQLRDPGPSTIAMKEPSAFASAVKKLTMAASPRHDQKPRRNPWSRPASKQGMAPPSRYNSAEPPTASRAKQGASAAASACQSVVHSLAGSRRTSFLTSQAESGRRSAQASGISSLQAVAPSSLEGNDRPCPRVSED